MARFRIVPVCQLESGDILGAEICDASGNKLVGAGVELTGKMLERIKDLGIYSAVVDMTPPDSEDGSTSVDRRREGGSPPAGAQQSRDDRQSIEPRPCAPFVGDLIERHRNAPYDTDAVRRFSDEHERLLMKFLPQISSLAAEERIDSEAVRSVAEQCLLQMAEDMDLFASLATDPSPHPYPGGHSYRVGMLAMSIGTAMGLDESTLLDMSAGCLLHDVGMLRLSQRIYECPRKLLPFEAAEIAMHPLITLDLLEHVCAEMSDESLMVAGQLHERCDGSGYPEGRTAAEIHDLAKIAAAADTFAAMLEPRAYRDAMHPHEAARALLSQAHRGLFDVEVVHALLDTVSGYPLGSFVELSDHRIAQVIRSNPGHWLRPVVQLWVSSGADCRPTILDLASSEDLKVLRPVAQPLLWAERTELNVSI